MEIPISDLEAYFGISLSSAIQEVSDYTQSQVQDQEIDESA